MKIKWRNFSLLIVIAVFSLMVSVGTGLAKSQKPIVLKIQIPVPTTSLIFDDFEMFAERVDKMSGGRVKIDTLPAGAVVGAFEILDAVSRGVLDGGHSWVGYWVGKNAAAGLLAGAPAGTAGMDHMDMFGWYYWGGGRALFQEFYDKVKANVVEVGIVAGVGPQLLGWFKEPVTSLKQFQKMKYRVPGLAADVYKDMGVSVVTLPGGEVLPAGERGVIDGAEWLTPADDIKMGFHTIWKYMVAPAFHDYVPTWNIFINRDVWNKIPVDLQEIIKGAATETAFVHWLKQQKMNADALIKLKEYGVTIVKTPDEINEAFLKSWDKIAEREAKKDPLVRKVLKSQREYARLIQSYRLSFPPPYEFAARYYYERGKK
ncbi:MAG: TRAP transporter substrate-binding protein [Deltaproteobacteria bacterium]|nr:TRAP transporter substrate-binding protein [Deltaproteobacteria bacterium]MBW2065181.1 TRAP transporter substrate-binding protein [Deltaproteobacteria bacterium]